MPHFTRVFDEGGEGEPFGGTAAIVPGTIEAEEFDLGGEGVGYSDADATNIPGVSVSNKLMSILLGSPNNFPRRPPSGRSSQAINTQENSESRDVFIAQFRAVGVYSFSQLRVQMVEAR